MCAKCLPQGLAHSKYSIKGSCDLSKQFLVSNLTKFRASFDHSSMEGSLVRAGHQGLFPILRGKRGGPTEPRDLLRALAGHPARPYDVIPRKHGSGP